MIQKLKLILNQGRSTLLVDAVNGDLLIFQINEKDIECEVLNFDLNRKKLLENVLCLPPLYDYYSSYFYNPRDKSSLFSFNGSIFKPTFNLSNGLKFSSISHYKSTDFFSLSKVYDGNIDFGIYNVDEKSIATVKYAPKCIGDIILGIKTNIIERYSTDGSTLWSVDYTEELAKLGERYNKILAILGISDGVIICRYDNGQVGIGIDVETGDVKWIEEGAFTVSQISDDGKLFSLGPPMTVHDVQTGKVVGVYGELDDRIRSGRLHYTTIGDHIIITGTPTDTIAAFNTETHKLDWVHKEEGVWFNAVPMKYFHPYLFVNDSKGNLHVFEVSNEMAKINNDNLLT